MWVDRGIGGPWTCDLKPVGSFSCFLFVSSYRRLKNLKFHVGPSSNWLLMVFYHIQSQFLQSLLWLTGGCRIWKGSRAIPCERVHTGLTPGWLGNVHFARYPLHVVSKIICMDPRIGLSLPACRKWRTLRGRQVRMVSRSLCKTSGLEIQPAANARDQTVIIQTGGGTTLLMWPRIHPIWPYRMLERVATTVAPTQSSPLPASRQTWSNAWIHANDFTYYMEWIPSKMDITQPSWG